MCTCNNVAGHYRLEVMELSAWALLIILIFLAHCQLMGVASLQHTGVMLILEELVKYIIVKLPVPFSLLEQVMKYKEPLLITRM